MPFPTSGDLPDPVIELVSELQAGSLPPVSPLHTAPGALKARTLMGFAIPFSGGPRFVRTLHRDPSVLGGPTRHGS